MPKRIAKYISESGFCSRREAEKLISEGIVKINDKLINSPINFVDENDIVKINNKIITPTDSDKIILLNKPTGIICSTKDEKGRKVIYDILPEKYQNFKYVGRLDYNSEWLLLLTNSNELKKYFVKVYGHIDEKIYSEPQKGLKIFNPEKKRKELYQASVEAHKVKDGSKNNWLKFTLYEGKNREIRKICQYYNLQVSKLIRISFGKYKLGDLKSGGLKEAEIYT